MHAVLMLWLSRVNPNACSTDHTSFSRLPGNCCNMCHSKDYHAVNRPDSQEGSVGGMDDNVMLGQGKNHVYL